MFYGLVGWHIAIILLVLSPVIVLAIAVPVSYAQGRARRDAGLVTDPAVEPMAIAGFVLPFLVGPAAIACGLLGRARIRRSGGAGWGFATYAVIVGWLLSVIQVVAVIGTLTS
jgi:hypothetical protein